MAVRCSFVRLLARDRPPRCPRDWAALSLPSLAGKSRPWRRGWRCRSRRRALLAFGSSGHLVLSALASSCDARLKELLVYFTRIFPFVMVQRLLKGLDEGSNVNPSLFGQVN